MLIESLRATEQRFDRFCNKSGTIFDLLIHIWYPHPSLPTPITMRILYSTLLITSIIVLFSIPKASACGYGWVGDCSSSVHLRINGTLDSFLIADCPSGLRFDGMYLGTLQNLALANAKAITWESCINNVSAIGLKYRVYEQGNPGGNFITHYLDQDYFTVVGPYTTRYRSKASNIDLAAGLTVGKTYVVEVFFEAEIDTIGDDFIPETTMVRNNNGQNYKLRFTYGGPSASPFVVIPTTVKDPNCNGESNGVIGVSVWGDHSGLFYNWSNMPLNFFQQNNLAAGTYTVTVTGANYTESETVVLSQPPALAIQSANIQPVTCGGGQGSIIVLPTGGTPPYRYNWSNGQTTAMATFPNSGTYALTLTDAHNCFIVQSFNLPGGGDIQQNATAQICSGESIMVEGQVLDEAGVYNFVLPGNGGCDTNLTLTITKISPEALLENLPSNILLSCNTPSVNLCAEPSADAIFQWSKDGIPATQTLCLLATGGGLYNVQVVLEGCFASKSIVSEEHTVPVPAQFIGMDTLTCDGFGETPTLFTVTTNAINPTYYWSENGQFLTSNDSCWFVVSSNGPTYTLPELLVTDIFGCEIEAVGTLSVVVDANVPAIFINTTAASGPDIPDGSASVQISGNGPFEINWSNGMTGPNLFNLLPGYYCATVTGPNGCNSSDCEQVDFTVSASDKSSQRLHLFPNPAAPGDWIEISLAQDFTESLIMVELSDIQGRRIKAETLNNSEAYLRFQLPEALQEGVFFLRIISEAIQAEGKVVLKR